MRLPDPEGLGAVLPLRISLQPWEISAEVSSLGVVRHLARIVEALGRPLHVVGFSDQDFLTELRAYAIKQQLPIKIDLQSVGKARQRLRISPTYYLGRGQRERILRRLAADALANTDLALIWNGTNSLARAGSLEAERLGIPRVYLELGAFAQSYQIDAKGINAASESLCTAVRQGLASPGAIEPKAVEPEEIPFPTRKFGKHNNLEPQKERVGIDSLPNPYLLFLGQVANDSQITHFSPHYPTLYEAISACQTAARSLQKEGNPIQLVVKVHPQEAGRRGERSSRIAGVTYVDNVDNDEILHNASAVVSVNSSMLLQAVWHGRPAMALGEAFFAVSPFVKPARGPDFLTEDIRRLLASDPCPESVRNQVFSNLMQTLIRKSPDSDRGPALEAAWTRILEIFERRRAEASLGSSPAGPPPRI